MLHKIKIQQAICDTEILHSLFDFCGFGCFYKSLLFLLFTILFSICSTLSLRELFKTLTLKMQANTRVKFSHLGDFWESHYSMASIFWQKFDYFVFQSFIAALKKYAGPSRTKLRVRVHSQSLVLQKVVLRRAPTRNVHFFSKSAIKFTKVA